MDDVQTHNIVLIEDKAGLKSNELMLGQDTARKKEQPALIMITQGETEMTQTIEQLTARVRELEEEKKELQALLAFDIATLTRHRDLAVEALEAIAGRRIFIDNLASNVDIAVMTLDAIKESERK